MEIDVEYNREICTFMFWDKDCVPIIGMTASKLRAIMKEVTLRSFQTIHKCGPFRKIEFNFIQLQAGEDHPQIYPTHLDALLKKAFAFRVKYSTNFAQCSIVQLNADEEVYKRIDDFLNPNEVTQFVAHLIIASKRDSFQYIYFDS